MPHWDYELEKAERLDRLIWRLQRIRRNVRANRQKASWRLKQPSHRRPWMEKINKRIRAHDEKTFRPFYTLIDQEKKAKEEKQLRARWQYLYAKDLSRRRKQWNKDWRSLLVDNLVDPEDWREQYDRALPGMKDSAKAHADYWHNKEY